MKVNDKCNLILSDIYDYDIVSCHYNLLENIGWDLSNVPEQPKLERNIAIGRLQQNNKNLSKYLIEQTTGIVQYYIEKNNLKDDDIICRIRDGIYTTIPLKDNSSSLPLELRGIISKMIITLDRKLFMLIYSDGHVSVKGVSNKPLSTDFYQLFRNLNFGNKKKLTLSMERMRQTIFNSDNIEWFMFKRNNNYVITIKGIGDINVSKSGIDHIDHTEIDKENIWERYVWPFIQPILLYCEK